jgi:hypothetical protein
LPISFYYKKKKEITADLIRENKIAGIACRVAASSNKAFAAERKKPRPLKSDGYQTIISNIPAN